MNKIDQIQRQLLPKDRTVWGNSGFNMEDLTYSTPVWKKTDCHACASGGYLEIKFALKNHELVVVSRSFTADHQKPIEFPLQILPMCTEPNPVSSSSGGPPEPRRPLMDECSFMPEIVIG